VKLGSLHPTRDLTYVKDTVSGFIEIAGCDKFFGEEVNIGMREEISMKDLVILIARLMNREIEITCDEQRIRPVKSEVERLLCDNSKLINNTGWKPLYSLEQGLIETIEWIKHNLAYYKPDIYNV
jgi:dTDP-glucose 4,6-dehydratase